MGLTTPNLART